MFCPNCGKPLDDNAAECPRCGHRMEGGNTESNSGQENARTCPVCGFALHAEDQVCPLCGTPIEMQSEEAAAPPTGSGTEPSFDRNRNVENPQEPKREKRQKKETQEKQVRQERPERAERPERPERDSRPRRRAWVVILIIIIVVVVVFLVLYFTGVISFGDRENSRSSATESTALEESEGSANVAPNTSYIGYWNISGSDEEELAISSVTNSTVGFSLWWRDLFRVDNATAYINEENIAAFSCEDSGMKLSGNLTFYEDYIIVQITESNIDYVDTGTMVFNEKHLEAWSDAESANASTPSSSSSDSSASSSSSTSNQNSNTASSGSNTNTSSYYYNGDYVLPNSSSQLLTYADVQGLTSDELRLARNEIYARHGRKFDDNALQSYFNSKSWYTGTIDPDDFSQDMLSSIERSNVSFIESYE